MQLRRLEYFAAVAEHLSFRKAAETLFVTQPLLSRQISALEEEIGQKLFVRNTRTVALTPTGELLYKETAALLDHADIVQQRVKHFRASDHASGYLRIGLEDGFDTHLVSAAVSRLRKKYPQIDISLKRFSFLDITNALKEDAIDVGFVLLPDKKFSSQLNCKILRSEAQILIMSKDKLTSGVELKAFTSAAEQECLFLLEKNPKFINNCIALCLQLDIAAEFRYVKEISDMLLYIESGYGVAALPRAVYDTVSSNTLSFFEIPYAHTFLCLAAVWNKRNPSPQTDLLLQELDTRDCNFEHCDMPWCCFCPPGR